MCRGLHLLDARMCGVDVGCGTQSFGFVIDAQSVGLVVLCLQQLSPYTTS